MANIKQSNVDKDYTNFMSYPLVEMMTWQGLGDLVNRFRVKTLGLEPVSTLWAPGQLYRLKVPYTYLWSPGLVPKPKDWGPEIDIAGFVFLELASSFEPPKELVEFLDAGEPPVYIGFGSIVVDDPDKFTNMIFEAVKIAGVRALVSKGWGGLGGDDTPDNIFMLENTPHDWLFPKCSAVIHHGGAGTTAIGLKTGKPTMIVPFFGDQPFWGDMVSRARAGAFECIPYKKLTAEKLAEGIKQCLTDEANENVQKIADSIAKEGDGAANAVKSFHRSLPLRGDRSMRCSMLEDRVAVWLLKDTSLRLSALAAEILVERKKIKWGDLRLIRHYDWNDFEGPGEPITGIGSAAVGMVTGMATGIGGVPVKMNRSIKRRVQHEHKKKRHENNKKIADEANGHPPRGRVSEEEAMDHAEDKSTPSALQNGLANGNQNQQQQNGRPQAPNRGQTNSSKLSADPSEPLAEELALEAGHGFRDTGAAIAKAPMDFTLALAQGFHNAPRLYGDETVRTPVRISGFKSGMRAGRDEFVYGIYDGTTGLIRHPLAGAKKGPLSFVKGIGIGIGGFVLKDVAAVVAPPAYMMKGLHKEVGKSKQPTAFVRRARIIQGAKDLRRLEGQQMDGLVAIGLAEKPDEEAVAEQERQVSMSRGQDVGQRRKEVEEGVLRDWGVVTEALELKSMRQNQGIMGRLRLRREKKKWEENEVLEDIGTLEAALRARKEGRSVEEAMREHRLEGEAHTETSRQPAMGDLVSGKGKKGAGEGKENGGDAKGGNHSKDVKDKARHDMAESSDEVRPRASTEGKE